MSLFEFYVRKAEFFEKEYKKIFAEKNKIAELLQNKKKQVEKSDGN